MIINNAFVMSCNETILKALASALGVADIQLGVKVKKLRAIVGTKFANSATMADAFNAGTLEHGTLLNDALNSTIDEFIAIQFENMWYEALEMNATYDAAYMADQWDQAHEEDAIRNPKAPHGKRTGTKSAKAWLRELLSKAGAEYTLAELIALTGKTEVNIRTMLSDLRSAKYAGKDGVFNTKSVRKNGAVYYSAA